MPIEQVNEYLRQQGYDPEQVGLRGKILTDALIKNITLSERINALTARLAAQDAEIDRLRNARLDYLAPYKDALREKDAALKQAREAIHHALISFKCPWCGGIYGDHHPECHGVKARAAIDAAREGNG